MSAPTKKKPRLILSRPTRLENFIQLYRELTSKEPTEDERIELEARFAKLNPAKP
jgi:hypothetical protein